MSASYEVDRSMSGGGYGTTGRRESGGGQRREAGGGMDQATPASKKDDFSRSVANIIFCYLPSNERRKWA